MMMSARHTSTTNSDEFGIGEVVASYCYYLADAQSTTFEHADTVLIGVIFRPFRIMKYRFMSPAIYGGILEHDNDFDSDSEFADHTQQCHHYTVCIMQRAVA